MPALPGIAPAAGGSGATPGPSVELGPVEDAGIGADAADGGDNVPCPGMALAFIANVPTNGDPAQSRVIVNFGTSADLPLGSSPRTIEFWAFVLASSWAGDANTLFEYGNQSVANAGFGLDFGGTRGTIDPYTNGSFDNDNQPTMLDATMDQWVHFAMATDGTSVVLSYVNGVLRSTRMSPGNMLMTALTPLTIGGNPRGAYFNGSIDEFRVWNVQRSQAQIMGAMNSTLVGNETGLVAYYKFDEPTGIAALDSTNSVGHTAHDGTLMAATPAQLPARVPSTAPLTTCP